MERNKKQFYFERELIPSENYQLVTPVSGAVVLETAEQYLEAGLEPVSEETSPPNSHGFRLKM